MRNNYSYSKPSNKDYSSETEAVEMGIVQQLNLYPEFQQSVKLAKKLFPHVLGHPQGTPIGSWADQLYRASTSVPANISEGIGKMMTSNIIQFYRIARGSAAECIAHLSLCPIETLDLSDIRKQYIALIDQIDTSLVRLIDKQN